MTLVEKISPAAHEAVARPRAIGLCMIVKNEAHVIMRCLKSVKPLIDYVLIEDTGSTDGTQQLIREWLESENIPGEVIEEPWQNFAYNRSHVMEKLREVEGVDYSLIIDADDKLVLDDGFDLAAYKATLGDDLYDIEIRHGSSRFYRPQICSNLLPFCFKAVLHEYLEAPPAMRTRRNAEGFHIQTGRGGARNKNPRKYQDDAAALEKALATEADPFLVSRYTFYLAQSYRDCGEKELALTNYLKRAELGYWIEEVFESLYCAAKLKEDLGYPDDEVIAAYVKAADTVHTRAEALHGAARFCRAKGRSEEGYQFAKRGAAIPMPTHGLFVESWIYEYGLLDEVGINGYWSGHARESLEASLRLLGGTALPEDQRERVSANARFSLEKLPHDPNLGKAGRESLLNHHALVAARPLRARIPGAPRVLLAILAKQKEEMLPLYLQCVEALDYPKSQIVLYIRTNNNTDRTEQLLREWVERVGPLYAGVEFDASDVGEQVQQFAAHEWNATRFKVLGQIRNVSLARALEHDCDFYFVPDVDNFVRPATLRELVALNLPIVSPLLRSIEPGRYYSNYHAEVDANGYYKSNDQYMWILNQWIRGVVEVPVVHTTYLIRADVIGDLSYLDGTDRHEYVVFSHAARKAAIPQYLDNRQVYGYIAFGKDSEQFVEGGIARARSLLAGALANDEKMAAIRGARPKVFSCFGLHSSGSTWMFNLVREVCNATSIPFVSAHRDSSANLPWDAPTARVIVAKTHNPMADFQALVAASDDPVVITLRDPRDAVVSFMQRFPTSQGKSFEQALNAIALSAERLVTISKLREVPAFRYEDGFTNAAATVDRVAAMLDMTLPAARRDAILHDLSANAVRKKIASLEAAGVIKGEEVWDRETHWHAGHVGDGKIGKWRDVLTEEQVREIVKRTKAYCERFGYGDVPKKAKAPATPKVETNAISKRLGDILNRAASLKKADRTKEDERELEFIEFCRSMDGTSNSQFFQDAWVLFELGQKRNGYFVEFGASDGVYLSNTLCLERHYGWRGALAEPSPYWTDALLKNRRCYVSTKCIYGKSGQVVEFREAIDEPVLSTIDEYTNSDMNAWARAKAKLVPRETLTLSDFLSEAGAPASIDYLSIDTEGSELNILENFDFKKYDIKAFSIEHNFTPQRPRLYELMTKNGYVRTFASISNVDDWYIRR
jgi:glycosyltransferase involved in cell wall biosynthesis